MKTIIIIIIASLPYIALAILGNEYYKLKNKKITLSDLDSSIFPQSIQIKTTSIGDSDSFKVEQKSYVLTYEEPAGFEMGDPHGTGGIMLSRIGNHLYHVGMWNDDGITYFDKPQYWR